MFAARLMTTATRRMSGRSRLARGRAARPSRSLAASRCIPLLIGTITAVAEDFALAG